MKNPVVSYPGSPVVSFLQPKKIRFPCKMNNIWCKAPFTREENQYAKAKNTVW